MFDRMMKEINSHPKISVSSRKPYRKLVGSVTAIVLVYFSLLASSFIPEEALLGLVGACFLFVVMIMRYIKEQKDSFGEVKRREINSILRQYECFTEKDVLIDFDVSDFGAYMTVTLLKNPRILTHVLQTGQTLEIDACADQQPENAMIEQVGLKLANQHKVKLLLPPDKQNTTAYTEGKKTQDIDTLMSPVKMVKSEGPRPENWPEYESAEKVTEQNINFVSKK